MSQTKTPKTSKGEEKKKTPRRRNGKPADEGGRKEMEMLQKLALTDPGETKVAWDKRYAFFSNPNMRNAHGVWLKAVRHEVTGHKYDAEPPDQELIAKKHLAPLEFKPGVLEKSKGRSFTEEPPKYATFNGGGHFSNRFQMHANDDPWHWGKEQIKGRPQWDTPEPEESLQSSAMPSSAMPQIVKRKGETLGLENMGRPERHENLGSTGAVCFDTRGSQLERFRGKCFSRRAPVPREQIAPQEMNVMS